MQIGAIFLVEAHQAALRAEATNQRLAKPSDRNRLRQFVAAIRDSAASHTESGLPKLQAYPYHR